MLKLNQTEYKLLLLDTNILCEVTSNRNYDYEKNLFEEFISSDSNYIFCFSIYNVIELKRHADLYEKFLELFSILPCFILYPFKKLLEQEWIAYQNNTKVEVDNNIANAFSPLGKGDSFNLRSFLTKMFEAPTSQIVENELLGLEDIASHWEGQRKQLSHSLKKTGYPRSMVNDDFYLFQEKSTIITMLKNAEIQVTDSINHQKFPAARIMLYSQYHRLHSTKKPITKNDVMDIKIASIIPYMNAIMTEAFQADVCKKAKKVIPEMKALEIYTIKDIR
jgi:hypothetical protein